MPDPTRILLIRPSALGDVCRSVAALATVRAAHPDAHIDWLVQDAFADAIRPHPALTDVIPFPRREHARLLRGFKPRAVLRYLDDLRKRRYDLVIDLQGLARSGSFAWVTRAPRRVGFANARELAWMGYTERYQIDPRAHAVTRELELLSRAGFAPRADLRLYAAPAAREWLASQLSTLPQPALYAVLAPTSRWAGKRWPLDRFAALARSLLDADRRLVVAVVGSAGERTQCASLLDLARESPRLLDLVGRTSVGQLMALVESAALVVGNDSAVIHMAVGFSRPLIGLYGPTDVARVGPWHRETDVIQHVGPADRLDHKNEAAGRLLMDRITIAEVQARARTLLAPVLSHAAVQTPP